MLLSVITTVELYFTKCLEMCNRPICGRSTGAYTNLGDLHRDLMGVKSHPTKKPIE
jgi:hypothetical protein